MKEVFSRKRGTSMKYKHKYIKIYNIVVYLCYYSGLVN